MERLALIHSHLAKNNTFRQGEERAETVLLEYSPNHCVLKFNRPRYMNSLNTNMIFWINRAVDEWNANPRIKVSIWKGDGKAFCSGGDLVLWREYCLQDLSLVDYMHMQTFSLVTRVKNMNNIQISIWNGVVMGIGAGMSINSKIRIATESTIFAMPEANVGYIPDFALTVYFARLRSNIGLYLALTGAKVTGRQVYSIGLADYFVPQQSLESLEKAYSEVIDENVTLEKLHEVTKKYSDLQKDPKFDHEDIINEAFGQKTLKEVFKKLEELAVNDAFARKTLKLLQKSPPRSLRVVFEQYRRAKNMDVNQGLEMDYRLTSIMHEKDFVEGAGWKFLRMTKEPKWIDSSIDIPDEVIMKYFEPIPDEFRKIDFKNLK